MSNYLTDVRKALKDLLTAAGFNAFVSPPAKATPPMVYVGPGSPYLAFEGASFGGGRIVRSTLVVVASRGTNEVAAEELDDLIVSVIDTVDAHDDFQVDTADLPGQIKLNGQSYLAVSIDVQTEVHPT